ncbi:MAG: YdcF family protein [Ruminococcus sp.]|nr:YdcF family protein [Ruminococcus sp.]
MRVLPTLISFILLLFFTVPMTAGILNLGNCAGAVISAALLGIFAFYGPFSGFVSTLWQKPAGKAVICIVSGIAAICVILALTISVFMVRAARDDPKGRETTIVVLGCKVKDGRPSLMLRRRLDAAYDYLAEYDDVTVIVSGGKGTDELISEAQCMKDYLVSKGISEERIIMEDKSSSTYENLKFSREIIEENGLNEKITIVTDGYHQLRAEMIAGSLDMDAYNIAADTSWGLVPTYWVREWFGVAYQFVFGK